MMTKEKSQRKIPTTGSTSLPGPTRKRTPSAYCYSLRYRAADLQREGCLLWWDVSGGREVYQIALERRGDGTLRYHCTCADAVFRGGGREGACKHVRGLQELARESAPASEQAPPPAE